MSSFHSGRFRMRRSFSLSGDCALLVTRAMEANKNSNMDTDDNDANINEDTNNHDKKEFVARRDSSGRSQSLRRRNFRPTINSDDDDLTPKGRLLAVPSGVSSSTLTLNECMVANTSNHVRLCLLGAPKVGKTAVAVRYLTDRFIWEYSGEESVYTTQTMLEDESVTLELHDSNFDVMKEKVRMSTMSPTLPLADGYVLVFSVTDVSSFEAVVRLVADERVIRSSDTPVLLMANKLDLDHSCTVSASLVRAASEQHGVSYCLASAREDGDSVRAAFVRLVRDVLHLRRRQGVFTAGLQAGLHHRKRRPSARIIESFNRMIGQIVLPK